MRVLFLTVRADLGGGPEHLYQLLRHKPETVTAFVACPKDKPYYDRFRKITGEESIVELPHRSFSLRALLKVAAFIKTSKVDILHSHGKGAGLYARLLGLITGRPVVHTFHGLHVGTYSQAKKAAYLVLERALGRCTRKAICVSQGEASVIQSTGLIALQKLVVIPNGIEIPNTVSRPAWDGGTLRIVAVNRYDHQKNPDLLIDIARALVNTVDFQMEVIGTGHRIDDIQARVTREGLDQNVRLIGGVPNPREYFRSAHVFLSTSRWEGMPLAVLEAMSEGLFVLATNVVGNADIIQSGTNGYLFQTRDEAVHLLRTLTSDTWKQTACQARKTAASEHSASVMADRTFYMLENCL